MEQVVEIQSLVATSRLESGFHAHPLLDPLDLIMQFA